jgi:Ca2+-binding RTX toxin-like protein
MACRRESLVNAMTAHTIIDPTTGPATRAAPPRMRTVTRQFPELVDAFDLESSGTGFAAATGHGLVLLGPSVQAGAIAIPTPVASSVENMNEVVVPVAARDLVFDATRGLLYASVGSSAASYPNEVVAIRPDTGAVVNHVFVGSDPHTLALSDDGSVLYIGLDGANYIARIDPTTMRETTRFPITAPFHAEDIEVQPGVAKTVAVSLAGSGSPRNRGIAIYDDGVLRGTPTSAYSSPNRIEFGDSTTLYGTNNETSSFGFFKLALAPDGAHQVTKTDNLLAGFGVDFELSPSGTGWTTNGIVFDPATPALRGSLAFAGAVEPVESANRVYQVSNNVLLEYELDKYRVIGAREVNAASDFHVLTQTSAGLAATVGSGVLLFTAPLCDGREVTINASNGAATGTPGDDVIAGTSGPDVIDGGGGNDTICGRGGNDTINGGPGNDVVHGDAGNDVLSGGDGSDDVDGGLGVDTVKLGTDASAHSVTLDGVADDGAAGEGDNVRASVENVVGSPGDDTIVGSASANTVWGGDGNDAVSGGGGNDTLVGGAGDDAVDGGSGDDRLNGGAGADELDGGTGTDSVYLTATAVAHTVDLDDVADDGEANEHDNVRSTNEIVVGSPGPDLIAGNAGAQLLRGMGGNDKLYGLAGDDRLDGGAGDDTLYGGLGSNLCDGGTGTNTLYRCGGSLPRTG